MKTLQNIPCVWVVLAQIAAQDALRPLFALTSPEAAQKWQAVNDGAMGGVSDGREYVTVGSSSWEYLGHSMSIGAGFRRREDVCYQFYSQLAGWWIAHTQPVVGTSSS